jgi:tRNA(fMet)-specific endonuclease VapC
VTYLLDTNACIQYLVRRNSTVAARMATMPRQKIVLCDVVKAELYYGAYKSSRQADNLDLFKEFFSEFINLSFDEKAAKIYGEVRANLERRCWIGYQGGDE